MNSQNFGQGSFGTMQQATSGFGFTPSGSTQFGGFGSGQAGFSAPGTAQPASQPFGAGFGSFSKPFGTPSSAGFGSSGGGFGSIDSTSGFGTAPQAGTSASGFGRGKEIGGGFGQSSSTFGQPASTFGSSQPPASSFTSATSFEAPSTFGRASWGGGDAQFGTSSTFGAGSSKLSANAPAFVPKGEARGSSAVEPIEHLYLRFTPELITNKEQIRGYLSKFGTVKSLKYKTGDGKAYATMGSAYEAQSVVAQRQHDYNMTIKFNAFANQGAQHGGDVAESQHTLTADAEELASAPMETGPQDVDEKLKILRAELAAKKAQKEKRKARSASSTEAQQSPGVFPPIPDTSHSRSQSPIPAPPASMREGFVVGTCTLMCPTEETQTRMQANQIDLLEQPHPELPHLGTDPEKLTIMKFQRSAAAENMSKAYLIRTPDALDMTARHLWSNILDIDLKGPDPRFRDSPSFQGDRPSLAYVNNFLMNRISRIRQELGLQGFTKDGGPINLGVVKVLEECARCEIALYQEMLEAKVEEWSERTANEALTASLKALQTSYAKIHEKDPLIVLPNEPEMQAYYLLLQLGAKEQSSNLIVDEIYLRWQNAPIVILAKKAYDAFFSGDFYTFFTCLRGDPPYLIACLLRRFVDQLRLVALVHLNGSFAVNSRIPLSSLARVLFLDSTEDAVQFCALYEQPMDNNNHAIVGSNLAKLSLVETGVRSRLGCKVVIQMRSGVELKYIVADETRAWMPKDEPRLNRLRRVNGEVYQPAPPPPLKSREFGSGFGDSTTAKERDERRTLPNVPGVVNNEPSNIENQRLQEEEQRRKHEEEARLKQQQQRRLEEERNKQEEERMRKEQEQKEQEEKRRREAEAVAVALAEKQREEARLELERQEQERIQRQRVERAKEIAIRVEHLVKRQKARYYFRWLKAAAANEKRKKMERGTKILSVVHMLMKARLFQNWRDHARIIAGAERILTFQNRNLLRWGWSLFENELGMSMERRVSRFRQSLLDNVGSSLLLPKESSDEKSPIVPIASFADVNAKEATLLHQAETMLEEMDFRPSAVFNRVWRVVIVTNERTYARARFAWRVVGGKSSSLVKVSFVWTEENKEKVKESCMGMDGCIFSDESIALSEEGNHVLEIGDSSLTQESTRVPIVVLSSSSDVRLGNETNRPMKVIRLNRSCEVLLDETNRVFNWLRKTSASELQHVQVEEVPLTDFVLGNLPRLKGGPFASVKEWLIEIDRSFDKLHEELVEKPSQCLWPPRDGYAKPSGEKESFERDARPNDVSPRLLMESEWIGREATEESFPPCDWNAQGRLSAIRDMLDYCRVPVNFEFEQIIDFASHCGVNPFWLSNMTIAARGDGLWLWEHVVTTLMQNKLQHDLTVFRIKDPSTLGTTFTANTGARLPRNLLRCMREPPHFVNLHAKEFDGKSAESLVPNLKRSRQILAETREKENQNFEQALKRFAQGNEFTPQKLVESASVGMIESQMGDDSQMTLQKRLAQERLKQEDFLARLNVVAMLGRPL